MRYKSNKILQKDMFDVLKLCQQNYSMPIDQTITQKCTLRVDKLDKIMPST